MLTERGLSGWNLNEYLIAMWLTKVIKIKKETLHPHTLGSVSRGELKCPGVEVCKQRGGSVRSVVS